MTGGVLPLLLAGLQALLPLPPAEAGVPRGTGGTEPAATPVARVGIGVEAPALDTVRVRDDTGRTLVFAGPPRRVVSLIPAVTEILFALGAGDRLVGRTRYGVHPREARRVTSVGGGVRPSLERIVSRRPDVAVLFAGPDNRRTLEDLERVGVPTLAIRHNGLEDLFRNLRRLGELVGRRDEARELAVLLRCRLEAISSVTGDAPRRRVYYEVWGDPPITVGGGSYLDTLIAIAGGRNVFGHLRAPSPRVGLEAVAEADPEVILLPERSGRGESVPLTERSGWRSLTAVRSGAVRRVDGDLVHRLGPRLGEAARALALSIHPELREELARSPDGDCGSPARGEGDGIPSGPVR